MHELDPEFRTPLSDWTDVKRWRKAEREAADCGAPRYLG